MNKKESAIELEIIREEQKIIQDYFEDHFDYEKDVIGEYEFNTLEKMIFTTCQKTLSLKGFSNKFWGIVVKYDLQSLYMKAWRYKINEE